MGTGLILESVYPQHLRRISFLVAHKECGSKGCCPCFQNSSPFAANVYDRSNSSGGDGDGDGGAKVVAPHERPVFFCFC